MTDAYIKALVSYAVSHEIIEESDEVYCVNSILALLQKDSYDASVPPAEGGLCEILNALCDCAVKRGIIGDSIVRRDLFDSALTGVLVPRPSAVIEKFNRLYAESPERATDYFYAFCGDVNYIRRDRIAKSVKWKYDGKYGAIDITVNLSKPEKDPKAIAAAKNAPQSGYPKCLLCRENEGYAGRLNFPARQNLRIIPITLDGAEWYFQYSPYVYYNEHCIVFSREHTPIEINESAFARLLDFITLFPRYFIGSNADLPIVGGSILSHEHFQGGRFEFAMERAPVEDKISFDGFSDVEAGIVKWPLPTVRLLSENKKRLVKLADAILKRWRAYSDESAFIFARTDGVPHNAITPIARRRGAKYELDLVLRNNLTTDEHPLGVFHPHEELHHIKKENIGLIEVMGLAVLPPRLKPELEATAEAILSGADLRANPLTAPHADWAESFVPDYPDLNADNIGEIIKAEVGKVFEKVLEHSGAFKRTAEGRAAFRKFIESV